MMHEEFGMAGGLLLLGLYIPIMIYGFAIGLRSRTHFGRLLALGLTSMLFSLRFHQYCDGDGTDPCSGRAAAADFL